MGGRDDSASIGGTCFGICLLIWSSAAMAEGALAVGVPSSVAKDGYALGISVNSASAEKASEVALDWCRHIKGVSDKAKSLCQVITTFRHQCAAEANDPKPGTPGVGWAIAADKETAERMALANCVGTAGRERRNSCVIASSICDTKPR
jgi:hypothetical protein